MTYVVAEALDTSHIERTVVAYGKEIDLEIESEEGETSLIHIRRRLPLPPAEQP